MSAIERPYDRGTRIGERRLKDFAKECFEARMKLGLSQREVARAARISLRTYLNIERNKLRSLRFLTAARVAAVLGLDLYVKAYLGGEPIRDAPQAKRLKLLLSHVGRPLVYRTEVPLPQTTDIPEQRAWDAVLYGHGERTGIEVEMRLYDLQAQTRRLQGKTRDDPTGRVLLVIADTPANRRVLHEFAQLLPDLTRLRTANVLTMLRRGEHPPTGLILL